MEMLKPPVLASARNYFSEPFTPDSELATKYAGSGDPYNPRLKTSEGAEEVQPDQEDTRINNTAPVLMAAFLASRNW